MTPDPSGPRRTGSPQTGGLGIWSFGLFIAITFPTLITWLYFFVMAGSPSVRWIYTAGKVAQFSLLIPWYLRQQSSPPGPAESCNKGNWPRWLAVEVGLAFGMAVVAIGMTLYVGVLRGSPLMTSAAGEIRGKLADMGVSTLGGYVALSLFLAVLHSLLEEVYWRWFVFGGLAQAWPDAPANGVSSLGFMGHHVLVLAAFFPGEWGWVAFFSLSVAVGGSAWAWLYRKSGSLLSPWLSHLIVDVGILAIGYDLAFRP